MKRSELTTELADQYGQVARAIAAEMDDIAHLANGMEDDRYLELCQEAIGHLKALRTIHRAMSRWQGRAEDDFEQNWTD